MLEIIYGDQNFERVLCCTLTISKKNQQCINLSSMLLSQTFKYQRQIKSYFCWSSTCRDFRILRYLFKFLPRTIQQKIDKESNTILFSAQFSSKTMTVCKFFQQGSCRFGQNCRFEHIYGSKFSYHGKSFHHCASLNGLLAALTKVSNKRLRPRPVQLTEFITNINIVPYQLFFLLI